MRSISARKLWKDVKDNYFLQTALPSALNFPHARCHFKDFFHVDHFLSFYWICYNIASVLCFGFLTARHVGP